MCSFLVHGGGLRRHALTLCNFFSGQVDLITITKADCAARMTYFQQLLVTLLVFKGMLVVVLLFSWLVPKLRRKLRALRKWWSVPSHLRSSNVRRRSRGSARVDFRKFKVDWVRMFRVASMVLFIAYPSVSTKILRLYNCRLVEGEYWLVADMRLQCFSAEWLAYAIYGAVMCVLYVGGLPLGILYVLFKRRKTLFGPGSEATMRTYGFLYDSYGPVAWFWETEELVRKLLLTAVAVLMDAGSPLQVTMAVMISGWSHVVHAIYKPWGVTSRTYRVQHLSLFTTTFVFVMGLLFKVGGVDQSVGSYKLLTATMLMLCVVFGVTWIVEMGRGVVRTVRRRQLLRKGVKVDRSVDDDVDDDNGIDAVVRPWQDGLTSDSQTQRSASGWDTLNPSLLVAPESGSDSGIDSKSTGTGSGITVNGVPVSEPASSGNSAPVASASEGSEHRHAAHGDSDSFAALNGSPCEDPGSGTQSLPTTDGVQSSELLSESLWQSNPLQAAKSSRLRGVGPPLTARGTRVMRRLSMSKHPEVDNEEIARQAGALKFFRSTARTVANRK